MKTQKMKNLYIDTTTSFAITTHTHEPNEYEYLDLMIQEIDSSTERELRNIMNEMGADLIPLFISLRSEKHLLRIQQVQEQSSTNLKLINLEKMKNMHRLFRCIIAQLQKEESCEERMLTLFFLSYISKSESNKALIASYPGILNSLIVNDPDKNEVLFLSTTLNELSKDYDSKHSMGQSTLLLHFLNDLLKDPKNNNNDNHNYESRMNAIEALKHLAEVAENQTILLSFDKGTLLDRIVSMTKEYKINLKSSSLALEFISSLINRSTIESLVKCTDLLQTLFELSTTQNDVGSSKSKLDDISVKASQTMIKISVYIRPGNCVPETYLNILMKFVKDVEDVTFQVIAFECLKKLATTNENRLLLANSSLFTTFICVSSSELLQFIHYFSLMTKVSNKHSFFSS